MSMPTPKINYPSKTNAQQQSPAKRLIDPNTQSSDEKTAGTGEGCCTDLCEAFSGPSLESLRAQQADRSDTEELSLVMAGRNRKLCRIRLFGLALISMASFGGAYYLSLYEHPQLIVCDASGVSCDTPLRCCLSEQDACVQDIMSDFTVESPTCKPYDRDEGCGPDCVLAPRPGQEQGCNFYSHKIPCEYLDTNWRMPDEPYTKVLELDISSHTGHEPVNPGSSHEMSRAPDETVWISNQESDLITVMTVNADATPFEDAFSMTAHPIMKPDNKPASGYYGLHAIVWPKFYKGSDPIVYLVFEYNNSVGIYNWKTHTLLRTVEIPLGCSHEGEAFQGGTCRSKSWADNAYECNSCMDPPGTQLSHPSFTATCPTGTRPHALAEDSDGNLWIALKTGALARLKLNGDWSGPADWFLQNLGRGSLPFFVGASPSGHSIWANSISYHELFNVYSPTDDVPTVALISLDNPLLYTDGKLTPTASADNSCPSASIMHAGPRPAGLVVLPSGAAVVTLYNSVGALVTAMNPVSSRGQSFGCQSFQDKLLEVWTKCIDIHHFTVPEEEKAVPGAYHTPAFLHITANVEKETDHEVTTLWLLGSANDFESAPTGHVGEVVGSTAPQPDELYMVTMDENSFGSNIVWKRRYAAPTQTGWLHRMLLYPTRNGGEILFATQLKADQIMAVIPASVYVGREPHTPPEYCNALAQPRSCSLADWVGRYRDVFSPDDKCPESTRYITLADGKLHVSASHTDAGCTSTWGTKFDPSTTVDPIITIDPTASSGCTAKVSFFSKVPANAPVYADAEAGALEFTLKLGAAFDQTHITWNGLYDGKGGLYDGRYAPPNACDNVWSSAK